MIPIPIAPEILDPANPVIRGILLVPLIALAMVFVAAYLLAATLITDRLRFGPIIGVPMIFGPILGYIYRQIPTLEYYHDAMYTLIGMAVGVYLLLVIIILAADALDIPYNSRTNDTPSNKPPLLRP